MVPECDLKFERTVLNNGLVLLISENPKLPLASANLFIRAGVDQNPPEQPGLAALTVRLLDEGTERHSAEEISEVVESQGGSLSLFSQRELSGLSLHVTSEELESGLALLHEMVCQPTFPPERFRQERDRILSHLLAMQDEPGNVAGDLFNRLIYPGTPLQHPALGVYDRVKSIKVDDVRLFHRQKYDPARAILSVAGDVESAQVAALVQENFGGWANPEVAPTPAPQLRRQDRPLRAEHVMDKEQVHILIGHLGIPRNHADYVPLQVLDVVLGSGPGFTSRIPRKLRDEQGLAYSTYADITSSSGIYPGRFAAYISTSPENRDRALEGLHAEVEDAVAHGVTEDELLTAQDYLTGSFVFELQSNYLVARFLAAIELFGLGWDFPRRYPEMVLGVTVEDVNRVARTHLDTVNYTTVIVGPAHANL